MMLSRPLPLDVRNGALHFAMRAKTHTEVNDARNLGLGYANSPIGPNGPSAFF